KRLETRLLDFGRHLCEAVTEPGAGNGPLDRAFLRRDLLRKPALNAVLARLHWSMIAIAAIAAAAELWQCNSAGHMLPHVRQLLSSFFRLTHIVPQQVGAVPWHGGLHGGLWHWRCRLQPIPVSMQIWLLDERNRRQEHRIHRRCGHGCSAGSRA